MGIITALIPLILVIVGLVWAFWLILRKGDMVAQFKMIGLFQRRAYSRAVGLQATARAFGVGVKT